MDAAKLHTIVEDAHVQPSGLIFGGSDLRSLRADIAVLVQWGKCGWRAAHASMAHENAEIIVIACITRSSHPAQNLKLRRLYASGSASFQSSA